MIDNESYAHLVDRLRLVHAGRHTADGVAKIARRHRSAAGRLNTVVDIELLYDRIDAALRDGLATIPVRGLANPSRTVLGS